MNSEDTRLINEDSIIETPQEEVILEKKNTNGRTIAAAAAGTVGGAAVGAVSGVFAARANAEGPEKEEVAPTVAENESNDVDEAAVQSGTAEQSAHVAQAQAQPQVQQVHHHHHNNVQVHNHAAPAQHAAPADPVDQSSGEQGVITPEVIDEQSHDTYSSQVAQSNLIEVEPVEDDEIRILGQVTMEGPDGQPMDVLGVAVGDDPALFVDVEQDGQFEFFVHDDNKNGDIEPKEVYDISDANITYENFGMEMPNNDIYPAADNNITEADDIYDNMDLMDV